MISKIYIIYVLLSILSMFMLFLIGHSGQFIFTCINKVVLIVDLDGRIQSLEFWLEIESEILTLD